MKLSTVSILFIISLETIFAATDCQCLCSLFYTRGGEKKLCSEFSTTKTKCEDWYYDVVGVTDRQKCLSLGENINECKGNFNENSRKADWTPVEGGRYHSCRFQKGKN